MYQTWSLSACVVSNAGVSDLGGKWVKLDRNGTNPVLFMISISHDVLKSNLKKSRICPIWGQSDPIWSQTYHPWRPVSRPNDIFNPGLAACWTVMPDNAKIGPYYNYQHLEKILTF